MEEVREVIINGCSIFFEKLDEIQISDVTHDTKISDGPLKWTDETIKKAAQPLVDALSGFRQAAQTMAPDELELSMQLELAINGTTPVFKVLSMGSTYQIGAKFVWKKE